jgi:hypothetical protein
MSTAASEAGRKLSQARWGNRKVIRVARELSARADELPATEREALRAALDQDQKAGKK